MLQQLFTYPGKDADAEQTNQKNHFSKHQAVKINQATSTSFTQ